MSESEGHRKMSVLRSAGAFAKIAFSDDHMAEKTLRTAFRRKHIEQEAEDVTSK